MIQNLDQLPMLCQVLAEYVVGPVEMEKIDIGGSDYTVGLRTTKTARRAVFAV